jgi:hypothetical protein
MDRFFPVYVRPGLGHGKWMIQKSLINNEVKADLSSGDVKMMHRKSEITYYQAVLCVFAIKHPCFKTPGRLFSAHAPKTTRNLLFSIGR